MSKTKNILITVGASIAVGAVLGMLYAPVEGSEARKKLKRLKQKLTCSSDNDEDRETLEELSTVLQKELNRINDKLEKI
jgi:gas vesicle protein